MKQEVIESAPTTKKLIKTICDAKDDDVRPIPDIGIAATIEMDKLKKRQQFGLFEKQRLQFNRSCSQYTKAMSKKFAERSPIHYPAVKNVRTSIHLTFIYFK